jgi:polysaccharide deacetylase 2 family uncharacterized protein YibQ
MGKRRGFFKIKFKKKQLKDIAWLGSMILAGYLLFLFFQFAGKHHPPPRPSRPSRTHPGTYEPSKLSKPSIVFVIDDIGGDNKLDKQLRRLGDKVTYAVLPLLPYSKYYATLGTQMGADVILHLPLDTTNNVIPGPGLIVDTMSDDAVRELLGRDLDSVPDRIGANNHCGSRSTADRRLMTVILKELKRRGFFFLDSYTTKDSVVPQVAREIGIPFLQRGVFLDNSSEKSSIREEIRRLEAVARKKGSAVAIGHYRKNTLEVLAQEIPRLRKAGFNIISLSELLRTQRD